MTFETVNLQGEPMFLTRSEIEIMTGGHSLVTQLCEGVEDREVQLDDAIRSALLIGIEMHRISPAKSERLIQVIAQNQSAPEFPEVIGASAVELTKDFTPKQLDETLNDLRERDKSLIEKAERNKKIRAGLEVMLDEPISDDFSEARNQVLTFLGREPMEGTAMEKILQRLQEAALMQSQPPFQVRSTSTPPEASEPPERDWPQEDEYPEFREEAKPFA